MHEFTEGYAYGLWSMVLFNIILFTGFIYSFAKPNTKVEWRSFGLFTSFLVALFVEMYGFPLTIYALTSWLGSKYPVVNPFGHDNGHLWGVFFRSGSGHFSWPHILSNILIVVGALIISSGWKSLHQARGEIASDGLYKYVSHPQYTGFIIVILGFLVQWPTIITLVMAPILIARYVFLAKKEEKHMRKQFPGDYEKYVLGKPRFIPRISDLMNSGPVSGGIEETKQANR
jgi:protein-S-isoprenylcysteine O-methyltransferase Ste14